MSPRISIVVPSFNHARFAHASANSVLEQTFQDWELVVVDDCSTDGSADVWRTIGDPRIRVFENESNLGTYGTQSRAVELAQAPLIAILNSDDFWAPEKLRLQHEALSHTPDSPFCYTLGWRASPEGMPDESLEPHGDWPTDSQQTLWPYLLEQNRLLASSVVFQTEFARFNPSLRFSGDWVAALEASRAHKVACVAERLTFWRIHAASSHAGSKNVTLEEIRVRSAILRRGPRWLCDAEHARLARAKLGACAYHLAALYVLWERPLEARRTAMWALRNYPNRIGALKRLTACMLPLSIARRRLWPAIREPFDPSEVDGLAPLDIRLS